jgi:hypothetical protein
MSQDFVLIEQQRKPIAVYECGSMSLEELTGALDATWVDLLKNPDARAEIAAALELAPEEVARLAKPPITLEPDHANIDIATATMAVVAWIASDVLLAAVKDLAKEEVKRRLRALWAVLEPKFRSRLPTRDSLGDRKDGAT